MQLQDGTATIQYEHESVAPIVPNADGSRLYTSRGIYTDQLKLTDSPKIGWLPVPAVHGDLYLRAAPLGRGKDFSIGISVHLAKHDAALFALPNIPIVPGGFGDFYERGRYLARGPLDFDQRLLFVPRENTLICIPKANESLVFLDLDINKELGRSQTDYLFVHSLPPRTATVNQRLIYQLDTKSKRVPISYSLASGPDGMTISKTGELTWTPKSPNSEHEVIVHVTDTADQEVFHEFKISVTTANAPSTAIAKKPETKEVEKPTAPDSTPTPSPPTATAPPSDTKPSDPRKLTSKDIALPGAYTNYDIGGGGRYIVLNLQSSKKIAILDVQQRKIVKYLTVGGKAICAAGRDKLVVVLPGQRIVQRWDLNSFERELTVPLGSTQPVSIIAMGSDSDGPILIAGGKTHKGEFALLNLTTLKPIKFTKDSSTQSRFEIKTGSRVRASADGRLFGTWRTRP